MNKIVVIGAGKTGRGFIGRLLQEAEQEIVFIDKDEKLVGRLKELKEFEVRFFGGVREPYKVKGFEAYTWENEEIKEILKNQTELIFVSVGGQNLKEVGDRLSKLLSKDKKYYIITAENASKPSVTLKEAMGNEKIAVSESTVFCTTIEDEGIHINSENYPYLQCNAELLEGYVPDVKTLKMINNFSGFLTRKLYTYNAASCVIAYLGWKKGYTNYADAANDEEILELLDKNYEITNRVLCKEFGYEPEDQKEFALLSKQKFCDRTIVDTVARNARDPQRKLAKEERILGPIKLMYKYGEDATVMEKTAAAALDYDHEGEEAWKKIKQEKTVEEILKQVCGLEPAEEAFSNILKWINS